jgi:hypothetical protein
MSSRFARFTGSSGAVPASPPPEVLDAIAAAHAACERLDAAGRHVRFDLDEITGRLACELTDGEGARLRSLSPGEVLDLASGTTPD